MATRFALIIISLFVAVGTASGQRPFVEEKQAEMLSSLPRAKAIDAARDLADRDFAAGRRRMLIIGKAAWSPSYEDYLKDHYGIQVMLLAIRQPEKAFSVSDAYNKAMKSHLNAKFGHDIFKEAKEATGEKW